MERPIGIEPTPEPWQARKKNLIALELAALSSLEEAPNWKTNGK
jgi:hypothetical protein